MKKVYVILLAVVIILALSNPTITRFKEEQADYIANSPSVIVKRKTNFVVFSIYETYVLNDLYTNGITDHYRYLGILGNFIEISHEE